MKPLTSAMAFATKIKLLLIFRTQKNHHIPFTPTGRDLETKSMPLDAYHETTSPDEANVHEIDAHSLYGTMQTKASHEWFVA
jgi:hypothetical protein